MEIKAVRKYIKMSPQKIRVVTALIKDLSPTRALEVLPHVGKRAADPLAETIKSAIHNAKVKGLSEADLVFKEIQVNEGPRLKRGRAGARGRWKPYIRKMSHIRVVLTAQKSEIKKLDSKKKGNKKSESKS